jgi:hypothetical protein
MTAAVLLPLSPPTAAQELRDLLGESAWNRLPPAVRRRFSAHAAAVDYVGSFEIVRASLAGWLIAQVARLIGTPVAPHVGRDVPATVRVVPVARGVQWLREYRWPRRGTCTVRSTKVIDNGALIEVLPAFLCMALHVFERDGVLHFVSSHYFFELPLAGRRLRIALPSWLSPGTTYVEHIDEAQGWFRFTMRVRHALFGEMFFQTGRFHAAGEGP